MYNQHIPWLLYPCTLPGQHWPMFQVVPTDPCLRTECNHFACWGQGPCVIVYTNRSWYGTSYDSGQQSIKLIQPMHCRHRRRQFPQTFFPRYLGPLASLFLSLCCFSSLLWSCFFKTPSQLTSRNEEWLPSILPPKLTTPTLLYGAGKVNTLEFVCRPPGLRNAIVPYI